MKKLHRWGRPPVGSGCTLRRAHPLREIDKFFAELSPKGQAQALNLKFRPAAGKGSWASQRAYPRGLPGQGAASWLDKPELARRIQALKKHVGVNQMVRFQ